MKLLLIILFCSTALFSFCQQSGKMETDRPDQTESPSIVKQHYVQAELGFNVERKGNLTTLFLPTALWKYGLSKNFEFRLFTQINREELPHMPLMRSKVETGLLPVEAGGKFRLGEEKGLLPEISFIAKTNIPKLASPFFHASRWTPGFRLALQNSLSDAVSIGYNLGTEWQEDVTSPSWIYTLGPGFDIGKNGYAYVEIFGELNSHLKPEHNLDAGVGYYVSNNVKLDASSGFSLTDKGEFYIALGISFRFRAAKVN